TIGWHDTHWPVRDGVEWNKLQLRADRPRRSRSIRGSEQRFHARAERASIERRQSIPRDAPPTANAKSPSPSVIQSSRQSPARRNNAPIAARSYLQLSSVRIDSPSFS